MMCPAETHEGQNLALMVYITVGSASNSILEFLDEWSMEGFEEISPAVIPQSTKIFVNGSWVGIHRNPELLVRTLRQLRRQVDVDTEVGVIRDIRLKELRLYTEYACCSRPLFIVDKQRLLTKNVRGNFSKERPNMKRENFSKEEEIIIHFHSFLGNGYALLNCFLEDFA
ncbi:hypothetical protein L1987_54956 [Smallanthus sonchifolius]|uniref:Uncharacterized protein n=1 Tax=Smallanthus sonchifolius TaxID=185202 RepID=A0ACB9E8P4_9ASTR|nr:hypothetical protein L1987_54956 [Smallanthus sonchifolius]